MSGHSHSKVRQSDNSLYLNGMDLISLDLEKLLQDQHGSSLSSLDLSNNKKIGKKHPICFYLSPFAYVCDGKTRRPWEGLTLLIGISLTLHPSLKKLILSRTSLNSQDAVVIANVLRANHVLEYLDLSNNHLRSEGAVLIAQALANNTSIIWLSLRSNEIWAMGIEALGDALGLNSTLTHLDVSYQGYDSKEIYIGPTFFKRLSNNTSLTYLDMGGIEIYGPASNALMNMLHKNTALRKLCIAHTGIYESKGIEVENLLNLQRHRKINHQLSQALLLDGAYEEVARRFLNFIQTYMTHLYKPSLFLAHRKESLYLDGLMRYWDYCFNHPGSFLQVRQQLGSVHSMLEQEYLRARKHEQQEDKEISELSEKARKKCIFFETRLQWQLTNHLIGKSALDSLLLEPRWTSKKKIIHAVAGAAAAKVMEISHAAVGIVEEYIQDVAKIALAESVEHLLSGSHKDKFRSHFANWKDAVNKILGLARRLSLRHQEQINALCAQSILDYSKYMAKHIIHYLSQRSSLGDLDTEQFINIIMRSLEEDFSEEVAPILTFEEPYCRYDKRTYRAMELLQLPGFLCLDALGREIRFWCERRDEHEKVKSYSPGFWHSVKQLAADFRHPSSYPSSFAHRGKAELGCRVATQDEVVNFEDQLRPYQKQQGVSHSLLLSSHRQSPSDELKAIHVDLHYYPLPHMREGHYYEIDVNQEPSLYLSIVLNILLSLCKDSEFFYKDFYKEFCRLFYSDESRIDKDMVKKHAEKVRLVLLRYDGTTGFVNKYLSLLTELVKKLQVNVAGYVRQYQSDFKGYERAGVAGDSLESRVLKIEKGEGGKYLELNALAQFVQRPLQIYSTEDNLTLPQRKIKVHYGYGTKLAKDNFLCPIYLLEDRSFSPRHYRVYLTSQLIPNISHKRLPTKWIAEGQDIERKENKDGADFTSVETKTLEHSGRIAHSESKSSLVIIADFLKMNQCAIPPLRAIPLPLVEDKYEARLSDVEVDIQTLKNEVKECREKIETQEHELLKLKNTLEEKLSPNTDSSIPLKEKGCWQSNPKDRRDELPDLKGTFYEVNVPGADIYRSALGQPPDSKAHEGKREQKRKPDAFPLAGGSAALASQWSHGFSSPAVEPPKNSPLMDTDKAKNKESRSASAEGLGLL